MPEKNRCEGTGYATPSVVRMMLSALGKPKTTDLGEGVYLHEFGNEGSNPVAKEKRVKSAYRVWMREDLGITASCTAYQVEPEEILDYYRRKHPVRARLAMERAHLGIRLGFARARVLAGLDRLFSRNPR